MDSETNDSRLRTRAVLSARYTTILVVCLLFVAAGAGVVYATHIDPGTETETQVISSYTIETEHEHEAEVTEPNAVFATGTVLSDRETYFTRIAPELDVDVVTTYEAQSASDVTVGTESTLILRNSDGGVVYWEETDDLIEETTADLGDDDEARVSFVLNSTAIDEAVGAIDNELGASPGTTETFVETDVSLEGTLNGEDVVYSTSLEFGIDHGGDTYTVDDPGTNTETAEQTETVEVEQTYGPLRTIGGPLLLLVGLAGAGGLVYVRREGELGLTDAEHAYLEYRDDRSEFAEWITRIRLPPSVHDRPEATAESLTDLVDFAIDNDLGVTQDPTTDAYYVVADEFLYAYYPPSLDAGTTAATDTNGGDTDGSTDTGTEGDDGEGTLDGLRSLLGDGATGDGSEDDGDRGDQDEQGERNDRGGGG